MIVVAMAGLPATGKSTLARAIAPLLEALVIDKDAVRAALFGASVDYTREQDDLVCAAMYDALEYLARKGRVACVVLDGRTYSKRAQVAELRRRAARAGARLEIVECTCEPATARARLERDARDGAHRARNRSFELYRELAAAAEPIEGERLVLASDSAPVDVLAASCVAWLRERASRAENAR